MREPVKVAYDLRWISRDPGGITTYALNLLNALVNLTNGFAYTAVTQPGDGELIARYLGHDIADIQFMVTKYSPFQPCSQLLLPRQLADARFSIFHSPNYLGFLRPTPFKTVVTVHDLMAFLNPRSRPRAKSVRLYPLFAMALRLSLASADGITTVSSATRADIVRCFPGIASKVRLVPSALNPIFRQRRSAEEIACVRARYGLSGYVVLYVGRRDPSKNVGALIRAIRLLHNQGQRVCLVLVGARDPRYSEPEQLVRELGLGDIVKFTGFVELPELQLLYQAADVLAFPSSCEGFGSPPLEAMASGTPVVCSSRASIPEVVGDAAVIVEPEDPRSIAQGIRRVLTDPSLREDLIRRGREQAQRFSWDASARDVVKVYRELLGHGG